eukprot:7939701-Prorocentrum_lima.AAC.1
MAAPATPALLVTAAANATPTTPASEWQHRLLAYQCVDPPKELYEMEISMPWGEAVRHLLMMMPPPLLQR